MISWDDSDNFSSPHDERPYLINPEVLSNLLEHLRRVVLKLERMPELMRRRYQPTRRPGRWKYILVHLDDRKMSDEGERISKLNLRRQQVNLISPDDTPETLIDDHSRKHRPIESAATDELSYSCAVQVKLRSIS